jgi:putative two-component system response regulator
MFTTIKAATTPDNGISLGKLDFTERIARLSAVDAPDNPVLTGNLFKIMAGFPSDRNGFHKPGASRHNYRTQCYVKALSQELSNHPRFAWYLTKATIIMLFKSAALHDIGMAGIPGYILHKPGRLEAHEFEIMKTHTTQGHDAILHAGNVPRTNAGLLSYAGTIALSHQEKWDGSGYPYGIAGDDIPIPARLMAVADVYDALTSCRAYREGMSHENAVQIMIGNRGTHFDADMLDAFIDIQEEFSAIALRFADSDPNMNIQNYPAQVRSI